LFIKMELFFFGRQYQMMIKPCYEARDSLMGYYIRGKKLKTNNKSL